jgi:frataxin
MDDREFAAEADRTLQRLQDAVERALADDDPEIELRGGILTISCEDGGQFVLNKHAPSREIWLSSPVSGATHFARRGDDWVSTRGPDALAARLAADIETRTGIQVVFG